MTTRKRCPESSAVDNACSIQWQTSEGKYSEGKVIERGVSTHPLLRRTQLIGHRIEAIERGPAVKTALGVKSTSPLTGFAPSLFSVKLKEEDFIPLPPDGDSWKHGAAGAGA